jgi:hypothetical protein
MQQRPLSSAQLERDSTTTDVDIDDRLSKPAELFQHRLLQETSLNEDQYKKLTVAFQQLLTLQRGE